MSNKFLGIETQTMSTYELLPLQRPIPHPPTPIWVPNIYLRNHNGLWTELSREKERKVESRGSRDARMGPTLPVSNLALFRGAVSDVHTQRRIANEQAPSSVKNIPHSDLRGHEIANKQKRRGGRGLLALCIINRSNSRQTIMVYVWEVYETVMIRAEERWTGRPKV